MEGEFTIMAIKFQYNKTSLQQLEKNLKMRQRTLPIIKSKETALRLEVKKCKEEATRLEQLLETQIAGYERMYALWGEFDTSLVSLRDVQLGVRKIAGVRVPVLTNIELEVHPFGLFSAPNGILMVSTCFRDWPRQLWSVSLWRPSCTSWSTRARRPPRR